MKKLVSIIGVWCILCAANAQPVTEPKNNPKEWSDPYPPFRIAGNLYYVGTYDLACYLIVTGQGHILINTGLASSRTRIKQNIESLGFQYADLKILLTNQAHFDHVGALATIQKETGAACYAAAGDAAVLQDGGKSDYELAYLGVAFEPIVADRLLADGDTIRLGDTKLQVLHHPGHTKGSCSYLLETRDATRSYRVLIANIPTIITEKAFSKIPAYPHIRSDYAKTLAAMKGLQFDCWVAAHASQFGLHRKRRPGDGYRPEAFIDRKGYDRALDNATQAFQRHP